MRLWSLHPSYLDQVGLIALWRESLLAKKVLEGKTKGYKHHPQLIRFINSPSPLDAINFFLAEILEEADARRYSFNRTKIEPHSKETRLTVTSGQLEYEAAHLLKKLLLRNPTLYGELITVKDFETNRLFRVIPGPIEAWEIT